MTGRDRDPAGRDPDPAGRDRDPAGRARNARPRDGSGRPLPYGSTGVERVPEDLVLSPEQSLSEAQWLLDADLPFAAHEVLEAAWKSADEPERALWQGLAQLAVGLTHLQRGNRAGAVTLLRRGADRIAPYAAAPPHRIAVAALTHYAHELAHKIEQGAAPGGAPRLVSA